MGAYRDGNVSEWSRLDRSFKPSGSYLYWHLSKPKRLKKELIPYVSLFVTLIFKFDRYLVFDCVEDKDKETTNNWNKSTRGADASVQEALAEPRVANGCSYAKRLRSLACYSYDRLSF